MHRIALAVALGVAAIAATPAGATMPGRNGLIAYTAYTGLKGGTESFAISTIAPSGGTPKVLLRNASHPAWSPDGTKIAFARGSTSSPGHTDVWVANADGSGAKKILSNASSPTWSPNGKQLAYIYDFGSAYVASSTGKGRKVVAAGNMAVGVDALDWAPTGSQLVYSLVDQFGVSAYVKIYTVPSTGKSPKLLVSNAYPGPSPSVSGYTLSWSPQATSIATSGLTATAAQILGGTSGAVPGSQAPVLALIPMPAAGPVDYLSVDGGGADWSPDGTALCANTLAGLEVINPATQTATVLVPRSTSFAGGQDCDWQPLPRSR